MTTDDRVETIREALRWPQAWLYPNDSGHVPTDLAEGRKQAIAALDSLASDLETMKAENERMHEYVEVVNEKFYSMRHERDEARAALERTRAERDRIREAALRCSRNANQQAWRTWQADLAHLRAALSGETSPERCPTCGKTVDELNYGMSELLRVKLCRDPFHDPAPSTEEAP